MKKSERRNDGRKIIKDRKRIKEMKGKRKYMKENKKSK
jgi:hypothetical protein